MNRPSKQQLHGALGTLVFHIVVLLILLLVGINMPPKEQEVGVPVIMGNVDEAAGGGYQFTEVKVAPEPARPTTPPVQPKAEEPMITQADEPSLELPDTPKTLEEKPEQKSAEEEAAEKAAQEAERQRLEAERIAREASERMASAFSKGNKAKGGGEDEGEKEGTVGSPEGNQTTGITAGIGGYGTFDLNGRSLGKEGLPRPEYNVQDEGRVVVNITVNPQGRVIAASINQRTNTANAALRQAAIKAASQAEFNAVSSVNNQMGTITYYFKLR